MFVNKFNHCHKLNKKKILLLILFLYLISFAGKQFSIEGFKTMKHNAFIGMVIVCYLTQQNNAIPTNSEQPKDKVYGKFLNSIKQKGLFYI